MHTDRKERRVSVRRRVLKGAIILYQDRHSTLPCTVRDLSNTGARLGVDSAIAPPDKFILVIELDGIEADCEVVRRLPKELGVKILSPLHRVKPTRVQVVRAIR